MRVDASVEAALNLLPSNTDSATSFSLYGLLNKAQSPMGKALLKVGGCCLLWLQVGLCCRQAVVTGCRRNRDTCLHACAAACCTRRCRPCPCCTAALPQTWIKHPLVDIEAIRERHDVVEGLAEDAQLRADLRGLHLRGEILRSATPVQLRCLLFVGAGSVSLPGDAQPRLGMRGLHPGASAAEGQPSAAPVSTVDSFLPQACPTWTCRCAS